MLHSSFSRNKCHVDHFWGTKDEWMSYKAKFLMKVKRTSKVLLLFFSTINQQWFEEREDNYSLPFSWVTVFVFLYNCSTNSCGNSDKETSVLFQWSLQSMSDQCSNCWWLCASSVVKYTSFVFETYTNVHVIDWFT